MTEESEHSVNQQLPSNGEQMFCDETNWDALRSLSLQPGGFGDRRVELWPQLLHVPSDKSYTYTTSTAEHQVPHRDERQIRLDTERSFVLYPVELTQDRETLQLQLHNLLVSIFRKRLKLSYFQGYHDIITVLFLTLPPELQLVCAEKISLHRVRDSMGASLEPVLGLLRIMKNLLRLTDPKFAETLERNAPLPFYALSNLLTLFSHDMPSLPLIQHVFDYLLCRPPIIAVYLATAIVLSRKYEVERLEEDHEEGMIHSLLSSLPDISDDHNSQEEVNIKMEADKVYSGQLEAAPCDIYIPLDGESDAEATLLDEEETQDVKTEVGEHIDPDGTLAPVNSAVDEDCSKTKSSINISGSTPLVYYSKKETEATPPTSSSSTPHTLPPSPSPSPSPQNEKAPLHSTSNLPHPQRPKTTLTALLTHADALYTLYPPTHPSLSLSSIMGPQSVLFTWSEHLPDMPSDDDAERMVEKPDLIVRPFLDPHAPDSAPASDEDGEKSRRRRRKLRKRIVRVFGKLEVERRTAVAGAVLVVGVAVAAYGMHVRPGQGGSGFPGRQEAHRHMRELADWLGRTIVGASEHIVHLLP